MKIYERFCSYIYVKRRLKTLFILLFCVVVAFEVKAEIKTFQCGDNCTATLDENGLMRVSGTGNMYNYDNETRYQTPWFGENIKSVIVEEGITKVGENSFFACGTIRSVELAQSVRRVGSGAFDEDSYVQKITMYDTTIWADQGNFDQYVENIDVQINCYGDIKKCKENFLDQIGPNFKGNTSFVYKGKKIYTVEEASRASKETGNKFMLRYK